MTKEQKPLASLQPNDMRYQAGKVWKPTVVINQHPSPRSYNIQSSEGIILRRNGQHLRQTKETFFPCADNDDYFDDEFDINIAPGLQLLNKPPQEAESLQPGERRYGCVIRLSLKYHN